MPRLSKSKLRIKRRLAREKRYKYPDKRTKTKKEYKFIKYGSKGSYKCLNLPRWPGWSLAQIIEVIKKGHRINVFDKKSQTYITLETLIRISKRMDKTLEAESLNPEFYYDFIKKT